MIASSKMIQPHFIGRGAILIIDEACETMKPEEIEKLIAEKGLVDALLEIDLANNEDSDFAVGIAEVLSKRNTLVSLEESNIIKELPANNFFCFQFLMCRVVPFLNTTPGEVMKLVHLLVECGGNDLAANQPNASFRNWCASDFTRADDVIASARAGDPLSLRHLVFALEAKGDVGEAFSSASAENAEQTAGVLALSRMKLTKEDAVRAIEHLIKLFESNHEELVLGLLKAALDIAGKHADIDRRSLAVTLDRISNNDDPLVVGFMAAALHWHLEEMTEGEVESCIDGILNVDPQHKGTIKEIDSALRRLWMINAQQAGDLALKLISRNEGRIGFDDLEGFFAATKNGDRRLLAKLATDWLLNGDFYACSALTHIVSDIDRTTPYMDVHPDDLPPKASDQVFVCRKAIGFLFISPMTAASWILAVLRGGATEAANEVSSLLLNPLLLSYSGALRDWLEAMALKDEPGREAITNALEMTENLLNGFQEAQELVELEPPASHRAFVRFQEAQEAAQMQEMAREKSILSKLVTTQTLLYGDQSSINIRDGTGRRRSEPVQMTEMSISTELPKGIYFDPIGTQFLLETFRYVRREPS